MQENFKEALNNSEIATMDRLELKNFADKYDTAIAEALQISISQFDNTKLETLREKLETLKKTIFKTGKKEFGLVYNFPGEFKGKDYSAWRILKDGREEYVLLPEDFRIDSKILLMETELGERIEFEKNELFFVDRLPFVKKIPHWGYLPKKYNLKPANEEGGRVAVDCMTHNFGDVVGDKVVTSLSSRWKQKKTGRILEYNYFDFKHLHSLYKPER